MLSWPTSVAGKHDKLSHFMGHISAVLAAIFWSRAHTDSRSLSRSAKGWKLLSSSLAYFRDQNPKPGNDKVSASGFSLNGEKKSSRNWGWLGLSFIVSMGGDSWKKNGKSFYLFYFLNTVTHYVTLLIFEEKWGVVWVLRLEYLVFREAKTRFENWPASSVHTNSFLLDFCTSFFFLMTHNVWKLAQKKPVFYILWKSEFLRQKCF